ncbi:MAG TPA: Crp/Fnr family transcriptional regulator [Saprospiraceae bacterium]|nr:Crp/Fnr family transcriptional regulator [Saprospiraceae bacterium]HMP26090.1 Crp/Fnr family transcriptional regulator [Saprospiraceae bacterium]
MYYAVPELQLQHFEMQQIFQSAQLNMKAFELKLNREGVIFTSYSAQHYIFYIVSGMVKTVTYEHDKELLEDYSYQGELINWTALTDKTRAGQMAKAMINGTTVIKIPVTEFRELIARDEKMQRRLYKSINCSLYRAQQRLNAMSLYNSRQRLIRFFVEEVRQRGTRIGYEYLLRPMLVHSDIAHITHTSRQTATTTLNELRSMGIIDFNRRQMIIRNMDGLLKLAGEVAP